MDRQASLLTSELERLAAYSPVFANQSRLGIADYVAVVCQVFAGHAFNNASKPKARICLLTPSNVSVPATREMPDAAERRLNIT